MLRGSVAIMYVFSYFLSLFLDWIAFHRCLLTLSYGPHKALQTVQLFLHTVNICTHTPLSVITKNDYNYWCVV